MTLCLVWLLLKKRSSRLHTTPQMPIQKVLRNIGLSCRRLTHRGGVEATLERVNTPGPIFQRETEAGLVQVEQSNVDLGEEAVNLLLGKRLFEANLSALNIQNKTLGCSTCTSPASVSR